MPETSSDEQELAKALENVANFGDSTQSTAPATPAPIVPADSPVAPLPVTDVHAIPKDEDGIVARPGDDPQKADDAVAVALADGTSKTPVDDSSSDDASSNDSSDDSKDDETEIDVPKTPKTSDGPLDSIKNDALNELRPLVDKLNVEPQEKFDTYLLLIRSTDDEALIGPAHEAAKAIPDEAKRAEALLEIIKEIDYLSHKK
jgi:hypothetical protein